MVVQFTISLESFVKFEEGVIKVIIGGAPVTLSYAMRIGADGYGADAVSAVEEARTLLF